MMDQVYPPIAAEPLTGQPVKTNGQSLSIRQCPCCDASHDGLEVREFSRPQGPFTHFFTCPSLQEPVSVSLLMLTGGEGLELSGPICQAMAKAQLAGRYLIAVYVINPDGRIDLHRTTQKFPTGDYDACIKMLQDDLRSEIGPAQRDEMKEASPLPLRGLLGAFDPNGRVQKVRIPGRPVLADDGSDMEGRLAISPEAAAELGKMSADNP